MHDTIFVGMDVHKATISVAVAGGARGGGEGLGLELFPPPFHAAGHTSPFL